MKFNNLQVIIYLSTTLMLHVGISDADIIEYELPDLVGEYYPLIDCHSVYVLYENDSADVVNFEIRVIGNGGGGLVECCCPYVTSSWLLDITSTVRWKRFTGYWHGAILLGYPTRDYNINIQVDDKVLSPPETLSPGDSLLVTLCIRPEAYNGCRIITWPFGIAYSVKLVIETESLVPVRRTTWGKIKAIYKYGR